MNKNRVWLEIDLNQLRLNYREIKQHVYPANVLCVLKANAYGLGAPRIARVLADEGVSGFCVANYAEAEELLEIGVPVQILGGVLDYEIEKSISRNIVLGIVDSPTAYRISEKAISQNMVAECHIKIDSGMGRLGIILDRAVDEIRGLISLPNINFTGLYSHFSMAYKKNDESTLKQVTAFNHVVKVLKEGGINFPKIHIANSDANNNYRGLTNVYPFNYVRTGINLLGFVDAESEKVINVEPIIKFKTRLISFKRVLKGTSVGYGRTFTLVKDTLIGIISIGYADGFPLCMSNTGYVIIKKKKCPIIGRVSMDYTTVSLNGFEESELSIGEEVTCIGSEDGNQITVEQWAKIKGTHPYEILCSIGDRVERVYNDEKQHETNNTIF
ncbi:MAG TPA: alanine racemase [Parapedobacter sp.]|uniref:alanine racemase n=1 Tax=Parapedobacter sp. TaxID=1958893 RepID=UPI002C264BE5|nr:alanine racemase [Parapedobacter sp.]HWK57535.1 alanine racemase [Parapedobacter sp.]